MADTTSTSARGRAIALTDKDVELFRWLWMLRVLTLGQLRRLGYFQVDTKRHSSLDNVRKRLKRLWDAGYLQGDLLRPGNERIYFLAELALEPLGEFYAIAQRRLYRPRSSETMLQLRHPLMVSECAVRLVEAVRGGEVEIPELPPLWLPFYTTHAVGDPSKRRHVERFVSQEDIQVPGERAAFRIRPDLVFSLKKASAERLFFLEADRGTEGIQEIALKLKGYNAYAKARDLQQPDQFRWQRYGPMTDFRVLLVTTSARRVEVVQQQLMSTPGFELLASTTLNELTESNPVFDAIWRLADGSTRALMKRSTS